MNKMTESRTHWMALKQTKQNQELTGRHSQQTKQNQELTGRHAIK